MSNEEPAVIYFSEDDVAAIYERRLKLAEATFGSATAYDTAITLGGYGAFFALWAGVSEDVTPATRTATAALIGMSLLIYIGWQILTMLVRHRHDAQFAAAALKSQPAIDAINEWDSISIQSFQAQMALQRYWLLVFGITVLTGVGGGLMLIYNCVAATSGLPQFTAQF